MESNFWDKVALKLNMALPFYHRSTLPPLSITGEPCRRFISGEHRRSSISDKNHRRNFPQLIPSFSFLLSAPFPQPPSLPQTSWVEASIGFLSIKW
ncbi:hypothetical protein L6164_004501 [Bauhinia variegata]|uniref:Uncharacterized protein n=1 Tax=Bauhinia variegata TaxID=167791 RepID=A0ACB9Q4V7_BAUVA|nr:hypothetical protein L6164_004501 [Bauhinia variegata]